MHIIETFLQSKFGKPEQSEDGFIVTKDFAAVVDGCTSLSTSEAHSGRIAMEIVVAALKCMPANIDKLGMLAWLTDKFIGIGAASATIFSWQRRVVWLVGDCKCRFAGKTYTNEKLIDRILSEVRGDVIREFLRRGVSAEDIRHSDPGRTFIFEFLMEQRHFRNDTNRENFYRYPILDGNEIDSSLVPEISVPEECDELVLASDGYPKLFDTLAESEAELARLLETDPLCIGENAGTKGLMHSQISYDDRCFLRVGGLSLHKNSL